jgi:hypothetical protein
MGMRGWVSLDDTEELDVTVDELDETEEELTIDDEVGAIELVG